MSTFQLSFKTKLGVITVKESEGYITDINFRKIIKKKYITINHKLFFGWQRYDCLLCFFRNKYTFSYKFIRLIIRIEELSFVLRFF